MYSILLVEDEISIRENLQKGVAWEKLGFYIAGDAANGEQALEQLEALRPDVLLTDIRMPFMDGLELSRLAKGMQPDIHIVVLSGYMEFAYAREAISIGVEEYLVKPVTPVKLMRTFTALREKMDAERREESRISAILETMPAEQTSGTMVPENLTGEGEREKALWHFLQEGTQRELPDFVHQYMTFNDQNVFLSIIYLYYFFVQTFVVCMRAVEGFGGDPTEVFGPVGDVGKVISAIRDESDAAAALTRLFCRVLDYRDNSVSRATGSIRKAENYIRDHFREENLSLGDAANVAGLSPSHFSYAFKQQTGQGFIRYLTTLRLEEAQRLLRTTDNTVGEIAEQVGYANVNYFSAVFHRTVGCTPKEYREQQKNREKP